LALASEACFAILSGGVRDGKTTQAGQGYFKITNVNFQTQGISLLKSRDSHFENRESPFEKKGPQF
jgi:hypothetical protein